VCSSPPRRAGPSPGVSRKPPTPPTPAESGAVSRPPSLGHDRPTTPTAILLEKRLRRCAVTNHRYVRCEASIDADPAQPPDYYVSSRIRDSVQVTSYFSRAVDN